MQIKVNEENYHVDKDRVIASFQWHKEYMELKAANHTILNTKAMSNFEATLNPQSSATDSGPENVKDKVLRIQGIINDIQDRSCRIKNNTANIHPYQIQTPAETPDHLKPTCLTEALDSIVIKLRTLDFSLSEIESHINKYL